LAEAVSFLLVYKDAYLSINDRHNRSDERLEIGS
ncbi:MAG: hypothetical protein QOJ65_1938, partial [Fimbriimonadaceae bacterium]|nr:hypothetical protein [Fimbriimonadaceae bacterium]